MNTNDAVFAEKLTQMLISAKGHKNVLSYTEIGEFFKGIPFTAEDAEKTIEFLEANGVDVLKMEDSQNDDEVLLIPDDDDLPSEDEEEADIDVEKIDLSIPEGVSIEDPGRGQTGPAAARRGESPSGGLDRQALCGTRDAVP